jgi:hypothetical protein
LESVGGPSDDILGVVSDAGMMMTGRAKTEQLKDAGSARSLCATGATEDAEMRRFAAGPGIARLASATT